MTRDCTEETFLKDVAAHRMTVVRDDGVHRHLHFAKPGTGCMHFELITWPGYLCYSGDMGCFVFSRLRDMFEFFRTRPDGKTGLYINESYWGQKLQAASDGGHKEFSCEKFQQAIQDYLDQHEASTEVREAVESEVLSRIYDGEWPASQAVYDFEHDGFRFQDFFEYSLRDYTYRFTWCCYALAWGIAQYDERVSEKAQ